MIAVAVQRADRKGLIALNTQLETALTVPALHRLALCSPFASDSHGADMGRGTMIFSVVRQFCVRIALIMIMIVMLAAAALAVSQPAKADETKPVKILILLDVSGSMNERISLGGKKFAAAKRSLRQVADNLPPGTEVGLRVYASTIAEPKSKNPKACTDTQLVMPVRPLDRAKMYRAVRSFDAKGETPIAYSLQQSVNDLGSSGRRVLVLISQHPASYLPSSTTSFKDHGQQG